MPSIIEVEVKQRVYICLEFSRINREVIEYERELENAGNSETFINFHSSKFINKEISNLRDLRKNEKRNNK